MSNHIQLAALAVIKNQEGKILLTKRIDLEPKREKFHDCWQIAGGGVEFGESPIDAVHREMREEIGTEIRVLRLLPEIITIRRDSWQGVFCVYLCELANPHANIVLNEEASEYGWFTPDEALKLKSLPSTGDIVKMAKTFI